MDERERVDTGGSVEPREGGDAECAIGRDVAGRELSPGEALLDDIVRRAPKG